MGAPKGNQNARKHGAYSKPEDLQDINDVIGLIAKTIIDLYLYQQDHADDLTAQEYINLTALLAQMLSRLERMYKTKFALEGRSTDQLQDEIKRALQLAGDKLGVDLS